MRKIGKTETLRAIMLSLLALSFVSLAQARDNSCQILIGEESSSRDSSCDEVAKELESREIQTAETQYRIYLLESLAKVIAETRDAPVDSYSVYRPPLELVPYCCDKVPTTISDRLQCTSPSSTGSCPSGTLRVICTYDSEGLICTQID